MNTTWVLVADSSRARIFTAASAIASLQEIETLAHPEGRLHEQDITSDLPGRSFDSHGQGRHAMGAKVEPKQQEQITFARRICDRIDMARDQGDYNQLILVTTPALLGLLRKQMSSDTAKRVTHEVVKNITRLSAEQIRQHLPERLPQLPQ
ncbi:MAG: host attachment protein [Pseudomonadota bacterium]